MIITCSYCEGTGKQPGLGLGGPCPVCDGNGNVKVPDENYKCNYCNGTGHDGGRNFSYICPVCNGVGVTKISDYT